MNEFIKKLLGSKKGILLLIFLFPIFLTIIFFMFMARGTKAIWNSKLKTPYRYAAIIALWSIIFVPGLISSANKTKTITSKVESENNLQTNNIQQPTISPTETKQIIAQNQQQVLPANATVSVQESTTKTDTREQTVLIRVVDGDTISVSLNGKNETIRIIGINTPETVDPRKPVECMGREASNYAKLYFEQTDKKLWLEKDPSQGDRDKYQRLLRYVFTDDDTVDYGKIMIALGYANEYTYSTPYKYQTVYKQAEKEAREAKKGLWADNACENYTKTNTQSTSNTSNLTSTSNTNTGSLSGGDKDCKDFATHAEAQNYFVSKGGSATNNVDRLDADHDGIACESLP